MDGAYELFDFEPVFNKTTGFRRIYVDLPGHGKTPAYNVKDTDDIFSHLVRFVDVKLAKSRFLVAGSSYGGYLARALVQKYIDQVDGLLLRVPLIEPNDSLRDLDDFQPLVVDEKYWASIPSEHKKILGNVEIQTPAYFGALKAKYDETVISAQKAADNDTLDLIRADPKRYGLSVNPDNQASKLLAPTLILCGRQDTVVGYRDSLRLLELYPRSTYTVLDRGTHALPVDQHALFEALVRDWLVRVEEWLTHAER